MRRLVMNDARASAFRAMIRAVIVIGTAFGFGMSGEQVAAIQLAAEAVLQAARAWSEP